MTGRPPGRVFRCIGLTPSPRTTGTDKAVHSSAEAPARTHTATPNRENDAVPKNEMIVAAGNKTSSAPGHFTEALLEELLRTQNTTELGTRLGERMRRTTTEVYSEGPEGAPFELYRRAKTALPRNERVPTYDDNAALVDELGRDAFAEVIAMRIEEAYEGVTKDPNRNGAIMVHLHGRWGSGKSSVLNFLKRKLTDEGRDRRMRASRKGLDRGGVQRMATPTHAHPVVALAAHDL